MEKLLKKCLHLKCGDIDLYIYINNYIYIYIYIYNVFIIVQVRGIFWCISGHRKLVYKSNLTYPNLTCYTYFNPGHPGTPPPFFISI